MAMETAADRIARQRYALLVGQLVARSERERAMIISQQQAAVADRVLLLNERIMELENEP